MWQTTSKYCTKVRAARSFFSFNQSEHCSLASSLPSPSSLLKLPVKQPRWRRWLKRHKIAYLTMKNSSFARFACAILIFIHFAAVLVLSMTWNDPFYSRRLEYMMTIYALFSCYLQLADINLISGYLEYILQAKWRGIIGKLLQELEVIFPDDVLAVVDVRPSLSSLFPHSFSRWARPKQFRVCFRFSDRRIRDL